MFLNVSPFSPLRSCSGTAKVPASRSEELLEFVPIVRAMSDKAYRSPRLPLDFRKWAIQSPGPLLQPFEFSKLLHCFTSNKSFDTFDIVDTTIIAIGRPMTTSVAVSTTANMARRSARSGSFIPRLLSRGLAIRDDQLAAGTAEIYVYLLCI